MKMHRAPGLCEDLRGSEMDRFVLYWVRDLESELRLMWGRLYETEQCVGHVGWFQSFRILTNKIYVHG